MKTKEILDELEMLGALRTEPLETDMLQDEEPSSSLTSSKPDLESLFARLEAVVVRLEALEAKVLSSTASPVIISQEEQSSPQADVSVEAPSETQSSETTAYQQAREKALRKIRGGGLQGEPEDDDDIPYVGQDWVRPATDIQSVRLIDSRERK